jgi:hypothetical protein
MTTGRINQVTTFQSAFAAIVYSRVTSTRFRDAEFIITFHVFKIHCSSTDDVRPRVLLPDLRRTSNPQMASPHFPFSHIPSEISFFPVGGNKRSPTYDGDYRRPTSPKRRTHIDVADPRVASCIRFVHRQAIHLLQHRSSTSQKDGTRLHKGKHTPGASSPRVRLPT